MLKKPITYTDFDGNTITDIFYFNLTKTELMEMELSTEGGMEAWIKRVTASKDHGELLQGVKRFILGSYGERSEDGKRFVKSPEIRDAFEQHFAYDALFMGLVLSDNPEQTISEFFEGIMPKDMNEIAAKVQASATARGIAIPAPDIPPINIPPAPLTPPPLPQN